jgi:AcrR family transcriptional regulator
MTTTDTIAKPKRDAVRGPHGGDGPRAKILYAALQAFGNDGYERVNMGAIADDAGVAKPLLHRHFKTKEQLWYQSVQFAFDQLAAQMAKLPIELQGLDPVDAFKLVLTKYAAFSANNPWIPRLILAEIVRDTERSRWIRAKYQDPAYALFESLYARAVASNRFRPVPFRDLMPAVSGAIFALTANRAVLKERFGTDAADPAVIEQHVQTIVDLVLHGVLVRAR